MIAMRYWLTGQASSVDTGTPLDLPEWTLDSIPTVGTRTPQDRDRRISVFNSIVGPSRHHEKAILIRRIVYMFLKERNAFRNKR